MFKYYLNRLRSLRSIVMQFWGGNRAIPLQLGNYLIEVPNLESRLCLGLVGGL